MGRIIKHSTTATIDRHQEWETWLFHDQTVGRNPHCDRILEGKGVSRFHARISWNRREWILKDLGSRNGTYINGRRQIQGEGNQIKAGDRILFGDLDEAYLLLEDDEPKSLLVPHNEQEKRISLSHLLPLPSADRPLCTIFCSMMNDFSIEKKDGEINKLEHGQQISIDDQTFYVVLENHPSKISQTDRLDIVPPEPKEIHLEIAVSPDEERAEVIIISGTSKLNLHPKVHFYLLAHLARIRASQTPAPVESSFKTKEKGYGWVDCEVICNDLKINREYLAQQVFRIRQDFKNHSPMMAERIIDRRLRGKIRIGFPANNIKVCEIL